MTNSGVCTGRKVVTIFLLTWAVVKLNASFDAMIGILHLKRVIFIDNTLLYTLFLELNGFRFAILYMFSFILSIYVDTLITAAVDPI